MKPSPADTHVVIAGAGIAGLAAAMILAEAGVRVTLCEAASEAGGKAKSLRLADGHPTEHSLRVYTDTYQTLLTLFSRIPTEHDRTVLDNLVGVSMVSATAQGVIGRIAAPVALQRRRPTFARIIGKVVEPPRQLVRILLRGPMVIVGLAQRGVPATDVLHYLYAHLRLLWMCRERLLAELGDISYADYLQLGCKSAQAQEFFSAVPRIYVAARTSAEAAAIAPIVLKGLFRLKSNCPSALNDAKLPAIMMMDGPTSERMVDPWIRHLTRLGVVASELPPHLVSAPARGQRMVNFSPLTVLMPGARHRSPGICTSVPNLLLAGEVIYSPDLTLFVPTMEKAACSGYLAARQIMNMVASHAAPLRIDFRDPAPFAVLRRVDRWFWSRRRRPPDRSTFATPPTAMPAPSHLTDVDRSAS